MSTVEQMIRCPVCRKQISEKARYCPECGARQSTADADAAWIAAMHEKIGRAKESDLYYTVLTTVGIIIAVVIPFVTRYILHYTMDTLSWILTIAGILFFIGGYAGMSYDERRVKALIKELEEGRRTEKAPEARISG